MTTKDDLKRQIIVSLDALPEDALPEVATFLEFLHYKIGPRSAQRPFYKPIALRGLWRGVKISDEDIADARREMWES